MEGAAEKGRPEGRGQALLFASEVRVAAFLPKSINCGGGGGVRPEDSGERAWGDLSSSSSSSSVREVAKGNKLVGGDGKALLYMARVGQVSPIRTMEVKSARQLPRQGKFVLDSAHVSVPGK